MDQFYPDSLARLLEDPAFVRWAKGEDPSQDIFWGKAAQSEPGKKQLIENARMLILGMHRADKEISDEHIEHQIREALSIAREKEEAAAEKQLPYYQLFFKWNFAAAALVILAIGLAVYSLRSGQNIKNIAANQYLEPADSLFEIIQNRQRELKYVQLPDGSSVVLHKNSSVRYPRKFAADRREVYLKGEAFFEITKNPDHPFFVYANELVAKVHGTSFSVKADAADEKIVVAVKTGKVSVFAQSDANAGKYKNEKELTALLLRCNEQATFERTLSKFVWSKIKTPALLHIPIEDHNFTYSETPVSTVFGELGNAYGVDIRFDSTAMANCSITATLGDEPLENKLKWICAILEAEYEVGPDQITIKGNPCR